MPAGLYVHLPFCKSKCPYCDFYSAPRLALIDDYISAILSELSIRITEVPQPFVTLYIGGGTPSVLSLSQLSRLVEGIVAKIDFSAIEEFTIEANPDDVTPEWASGVKSLGVNRVSIGVQSLIDEELQAINRRHDAAKALDAINILRNTGISEISADLIYGLPLQTVDSWRYSLKTLLSLHLPHFSAYCLSYEQGTRLYAMRSTGKITETEEDTIAEMNRILVTEATSEGYQHYEISNFCLPCHQSRHNSAYWNLSPYLGLGPSAHSFDGSVRRYNPANLNDYITSLNRGVLTTVIDDETPSQRINDYIITALRTSAGIDINLMRHHFPAPLVNEFLSKAHLAVANGSLIPNPSGGFSIPPERLLVADSIMVNLLVD